MFHTLYLSFIFQPLIYPAIAPTPLRNNRWYYRIYCMAINVIFACALPLGLLLYLNFYTVIGKYQLIFQHIYCIFKLFYRSNTEVIFCKYIAI